MSNARFPMVIAIDDTEYAEVVLEHAFDQAARHSAPDLHVVRVVDKHVDLAHEVRWLESTIVDAVEGMGGDRRGWRARVHVRTGKPADEIVGLAAEIKARLIVIGRFGMHGHRSIADRVIDQAPCPTLVIGSLGREVDAQPACPACVQVREESDGHRWFCAEHAAPDRLRLSSLVPSITGTRGSFY